MEMKIKNREADNWLEFFRALHDNDNGKTGKVGLKNLSCMDALLTRRQSMLGFGLSLTIINIKNKQRLYSYPDLVHNFTDLRFKSHIQHPVSLIQHQICASAQVCLSSLQEVNKPPRSRNADLNPYKKALQEVSKERLYILTVIRKQKGSFKHIPLSRSRICGPLGAPP